MDHLQNFSLGNRAKTGARSTRTILSAVLILTFTSWPVAADPWKTVADWVLVGSAGLGGCTMATRLPGGSFISITKVAAHGEQRWELLISDSNWSHILDGSTYAVDVVLVGSEQGLRRRQMSGFSKFPLNRKFSNALYAEFSSNSEFSSFMSKGMATGTHLALYIDSKMLGIYPLNKANMAYEELLKCYEYNSSFRA